MGKKFLTDAITAENRISAPCDEPGKITCVHYKARAYALEAIYHTGDIHIDKNMYIYTPYGYDSDRKYNVLYLMHGGMDNEGYWFAKGTYADSNDGSKFTPIGNITQNVIDHLIQDKVIEPLIVVAPSFCEESEEYQNKGDRAFAYFETTNYFWMELKYDIMPYIQQNYSTYAEEATEEAFIRARDHHAYAGLSQGSVTGFNSVLMHCVDYFSYIGNFSAGAVKFSIGEKGVNVEADEQKLGELKEKLGQGEFKDYEIKYWYNGCGDKDHMYPTHREAYEKLLAGCPNKFREGENCFFNIHNGGVHEYRCWIADLYNVLQVFFQ